jgi:serine protease AprX
MWAKGFTGSGVDIALIDTGIAPVDGLRQKGKVVNGPDLSFDSQVKGLEYLDAYGHGTHLAGIIAGRVETVSTLSKYDDTNFVGVAPNARIVNVKVADAVGSTDVSQVIAAIDWVIDHRRDNGMNVRVITLAYGTDGTQSYEVDPLAHAVERAWQAGIVVVVAAGNDGNGSPLRNPASDPFVIAVGASENTGRKGVIYDDAVTQFSNCGSSRRGPDIVAPGKSIVSLRNPGSFADSQNPEARVGTRYFLGSGSSQAAAVVSGAVALLLEQRPGLTPDQVKELLMDTARPLEGAKAICQGAGALNLKKAVYAATPSAKESFQSFTSSTGTGSLESARGTMHVYSVSGDAKSQLEPIPLTGEVDIMGSKWTPYECKAPTYCATKWRGGSFNGASWSGSAWSGSSWSGASWSGASWSGASWSGASWSGASWSGASWSGASWSGASWSGASWSGASWSGDAWSAEAWG